MQKNIQNKEDYYKYLEDIEISEIDKIQITITELQSVLHFLCLSVPANNCEFANCTIYHINIGVVYNELKKYLTTVYIKKNLQDNVYMCKHGRTHVCSDSGCLYSKSTKLNSEIYCSITNRTQSTYAHGADREIQMKNGNTLRIQSKGINRNKIVGSVNSNSYNLPQSNFDKQFNKNIEKFNKARENVLQTIGQSLRITDESNATHLIVKKRSKKNKLRSLKLTKKEFNILLRIFLRKAPLYCYYDCKIYFSSRRFFLNFSKYFNSIKLFIADPKKASVEVVKNVMIMLIGFEKLSFTTLFKKEKFDFFKNTKKKKFNEECETYMHIVRQTELVLSKTLPGASRFISYMKKITELHKAFFVKYLNVINRSKPIIKTNHENKIIFKRLGIPPSFFEFLRIFDFDQHWFESKNEEFPTFSTFCKLIRRSLLLYFLRETCSKNNNSKKSKCIDPSEHCIAFLDLTKHGFEIKINGFSHVILKRDIFVVKNLERLNKLTFIGFNSSSHKKGLKSLITDLNYIVKRFGPTKVFNFINYY